MNNRFVTSLANAANVGIAGAKAHNLCLAAAAGLPVPTSAVVTKYAWDLFLKEAGVEEVAASLEVLGPKDDDTCIRERAKELHALLSNSTFPEAVKIELRAYLLNRFEGAPVAVRSSALAEDSRKASFAGQFETFLNLLTPDEIENAVKMCWLSTLSERVVEYRIKRNLLPCPLSMAVLIQSMVRPEAAGVLFSRNPLSEEPQEIWVTSSWGLGTSVVDGAIIPDRYILARADGKLISSFIGKKFVREDAAEHGGVERKAVEASLESIPSLTEEELRIIWKMAMQVEEVLGGSVDVEWAVSGGKTLLLQARPITI